MKNGKLKVIFASLFVFALTAAHFSIVKETDVADVAAESALSQSFVSDGTENDFWDNKNISLPAKYYTTATV
ncbi:MAG: hypothetical protein ACI4SH_01885, partial [Candidatus Scatosoma sp.]